MKLILTLKCLYSQVKFPSIKWSPGMKYVLHGLLLVSQRPSKPVVNNSGVSCCCRSQAYLKYHWVQLHIPIKCQFKNIIICMSWKQNKYCPVNLCQCVIDILFSCCMTVLKTYNHCPSPPLTLQYPLPRLCVLKQTFISYLNLKKACDVNCYCMFVCDSFSDMQLHQV